MVPLPYWLLGNRFVDVSQEAEGVKLVGVGKPGEGRCIDMPYPYPPVLRFCECEAVPRDPPNALGSLDDRMGSVVVGC